MVSMVSIPLVIKQRDGEILRCNNSSSSSWRSLGRFHGVVKAHSWYNSLWESSGFQHLLPLLGKNVKLQLQRLYVLDDL
jgi:hypothetical protein